MSEYATFIESKRVNDPDTGFEIDRCLLNKNLFDFQRDIVKWALRRGRACVWADCGLGKSIMQLDWAYQVMKKTDKHVLILAPLAVSHQTIREGNKFGIDIEEISDGIHRIKIGITNYEKLHKIDMSVYGGIVLDESSILKSHTGKLRNAIIETSQQIPFRLACTATPSPNDFMELGNHAEFVGSMSRTEMLSMFFVHDGGETQKWRLKGHAQIEFWKWVCSWAVMIRKPSDLGYEDKGYNLPPLNMHHHEVEVSHADSADGLLFRMPASTLQERQKERKLTIEDRAKKCAYVVSKDSGQWLILCNLNDEAKALKSAIPDAIEVRGSDSDKVKTDRLLGFSDGKYRVLISKPKICGHGMNFQRCNNVAFVGLSDSYEQFYQSIRRCWRFGQKNEVNCHIITAETEGAVVKNIERKDKDAKRMADEMVSNMHVFNESALKDDKRQKTEYNPTSKMIVPLFC